MMSKDLWTVLPAFMFCLDLRLQSMVQQAFLTQAPKAAEQASVQVIMAVKERAETLSLTAA